MIMNSGDLQHRTAKVKMIILDVDGVMTDGRTFINTEGVESKAFDLKDGFGIVMARKAGIKFGIITGLASPIVRYRAGQLGIEEIHQNLVDKDIALEEIAKEYNLDYSEIAYMGDDLYDLPVIKLVGLSAAPSDAMPEVKEAVDWVSSHKGGRGAVREFVELVMKAKGIWEDAVHLYSKEE